MAAAIIGKMLDLETNGKTGHTVIRPKLLLADDSATIRKVVELTFADEGIDVTSATDSSSAMEKFVETQPDIVMVDVGLPGTSGYQICEMIKQDEATRHIPVLLLVGSFEPFDQDEAERVAADGFLIKPFKSIRELVNRVQELLEPHYAEDAPMQVNNELPGEAIDNEKDLYAAKSLNDLPKTSDSTDIENLYQRSFINTAETGESETADDLLVDSGMDDDLIDASYHIDAAIGATSDTEAPDKYSGSFDRPPASLVESPTSSGSAAADRGPESTQYGAALAKEDHSALEIKTGDPVQPAVPMAEPSGEFIALVAQRVVERLSDRAIRDIAREVVPRIAEKLIREALIEEKKG